MDNCNTCYYYWYCTQVKTYLSKECKYWEPSTLDMILGLKDDIGE